MVIKLTVSQTSGRFSSMQAGGVFYYYGHMLLMNIINCISAQISLLKEICVRIEKYKNCTTSFCQGWE